MSLYRRRLMMLIKKDQEPPNYLAFTALADGTFTLTIGASVTLSDLSYVEYSTDEGETWTKTNNVASTAVTITTPTITQGNRVLWRGIGSRTARGTSSGNYSVFSSTCNYNVGGHIGSLINGSSKREYDSISSNYAFAYLFYNNTKLISSSELVLPNIATQYCFSNLFNGCTGHVTTFEELRPLKLYAYSAHQMFRGNTALLKPPSINATVCTGNYVLGNCFHTCNKVNYIKCLVLTKSSTSFSNWVTSVAATGIFVKHINATWTNTGASGVPTGWTIIYYNPSTDKYYLSDKVTECNDHGKMDIKASLINVSSSVDLPTSVTPNSSFTVTLTPNTSCIMTQVSVTMGGVDITSTAYDNGVITISQVTGAVSIAAQAVEVITFQDATVKQLCVQYWGGGTLAGEITPTEAANVHNLGKDKNGNDINEGAGPFYGNTDITSFDEFIYFTGINEGSGLYWKQTGSNANQSVRGKFSSCSNLVSIKIPRMVTTNISGLFYGCTKLEEVDLSNVYGFTSTRFTYTFYGCTHLKKVVFPDFVLKPSHTYSPFGMSTSGRSQVLEYIDFKSWDFSTVPTPNHTPAGMLMGCTGLKYLPSGMHNLAHTQSFARNPLTHDAAVALLNSLATVTGQTITFAADTYNTLTVAEIAIGTNKGWTVSSA